MRVSSSGTEARLFRSLLDEASERLHQLFRSGKLDCQMKEDGTPVTNIDRIVDLLLRERLEADFPHCNIFTEEGAPVQKSSLSTVYADPLDGTKPLKELWPTGAVSLGLRFGEEIVLGAVADPFAVVTALATNDGLPTRYWRDGCPEAVAQVSPATVLKGATVEINGSRLGTGVPYYEVIAQLCKLGCKVERHAATVGAGLRVALGTIDAVVHYGDKPWDIAGVDILVRAAGGRVSNLEGDALDYDHLQGAILCNENLYSALLAVVRGI